jgi:hypothetical protein
MKGNKMKLMKIPTLLACLLLSHQSMAQAECVLPETFSKQVCTVLEINQNSIEKRKEERAALAQLQESLYEATELQNRLQDPENLQEGELLEESLINEMALLAEEKEGQTYKTVASVGSLMVFSFIVKRMYNSANGASMLAKIKSQANPFSGGALKSVVNSALVFSLGMSIYSAYSIKRTNDQMNDLQELIETLNQLKDQAQNLAKMTTELEEVETCFWFKAEYLVEQGFATIKDSKLSCNE